MALESRDEEEEIKLNIHVEETVGEDSKVGKEQMLKNSAQFSMRCPHSHGPTPVGRTCTQKTGKSWHAESLEGGDFEILLKGGNSGAFRL